MIRPVGQISNIEAKVDNLADQIAEQLIMFKKVTRLHRTCFHTTSLPMMEFVLTVGIRKDFLDL